ncbi:hypothetical protein BT69DRAFT_846671 [Atractiella rhizophila]|nr:hypothetical protein BT69DRAFT_846671 [Atractiella rhizophila]
MPLSDLEIYQKTMYDSRHHFPLFNPTYPLDPSGSIRRIQPYGECEIGDFGYCRDGQFWVSRNVRELLGPGAPELGLVVLDTACCCPGSPIYKGTKSSTNFTANVTAPMYVLLLDHEAFHAQ